MTYRIEVFTHLCATKMFVINGIIADELDFGYGEDVEWENASPYVCKNRQFIIDRSLMPGTCDRYGISENEFEQIAAELKEKLSFGECGWCA